MIQLFLTILFFTICVPDFMPPAEEKSPEQLIALSDRARGNVDGIEWMADLTSMEQGRSQKCTLKIQIHDANSLTEVTAPRKVKGRMLHMRDGNKWFIKPGLRKPAPISPRQKLMDGASNGDIASTDYAGD
jgi:hypothetical protein